ncbi:DNA polymerase III subunit alpha [Streptomyces halobius]|uniref:DNA-directed DNA polymerase n=1 Tax=Streptomyces halobius TaxID=2879846 RepID=A0ABY4MIP5_9ACTN|nr:DNA polymerase III subunit alpha [Streptomyces halobius]UQA96280.1 DNA polymerase III subunit alpha [Streptomyces halobius]
MPGFTHLHTASGFSLRYGASHPERLAERAAERGMDALALTDRDGLSGAIRFAKAAVAAGVRPLFGTELAVAGHGTAPVAPVRRRTPVRGGAFLDESAARAVFLARDGAAGWAALCRLVSAAHADRAGNPAHAGQPVLPWSALETATDGLHVLLGPDSEVGRALAEGRPDRAARLLAPWRELYGDALRLEVVDHGRTDSGPGSRRLAAHTLGFAVDQGIRAVLTNAVRYADPGQGPVADILDSARRLVPLDRHHPEAWDTGERWLKDTAAMSRTAERIAEAAGFRRDLAHRLLTMTEETAAGCLVDPEDDIGLGHIHFPESRLVGAGHRTAARVLRSRCAAGMVLRGYDRDRERWARLHDELRTIERLGYPSYFLTVAQVVDDVRKMGIRVAARGSGAGSLVNHLLGIAHADPVEHGLLMERFLSERRAALPDIDIDVESARRLEVYRAIFDRFGAERVATVSMPETYRVRHAVRDVGAALGMDPAHVDRLAKSFPHIRARDARAALAELPELRGVREAGGERLWQLVEALDALPRGIAMHPCGVLLSDATLRGRTPVVPTSGEGFPMSQFDKDDVEDLGLLKLDVLGVRMQSAMAHAVAEIGRATGRRIDLDDPAQVPPGDPATYHLIRSTETLGCFQIESPGQRDLIGRLQPATFHDLVVDISLFRPGPVAADMVRPFIEARHGRKPARYPHPDLEEPLRETYGVVVFHEQIIETLRIMTGCARDEADEKRRALSDPEGQDGVHAWFAEHAERRGYPPEAIARTWEIVEAFGAYGFCKAHAVAFAVPTYQSAWLKAHHPAAFYAGLLTHDPGMYPKRLLLADARRRGVPVLPLDVNRSGVEHRIELVSDGGVGPGEGRRGGAAGAGVSSVGAAGAGAGAGADAGAAGAGSSGVGAPRSRAGVSDGSGGSGGSGAGDPGADAPGVGEWTGVMEGRAGVGDVEPLRVEGGVPLGDGSAAPGVWGLRLALSDVHGMSEAEARRIEAGQPYHSLQDLWQRAHPSRPVAERLAKVGALDAFGANRRDLLLHIAELHHRQRHAPGGQLTLPGRAVGAGRDGSAGRGAIGQETVTDVVEPVGLPDLSDVERLSAELGVLGMDASRHLMADHREFLAELGALPARMLRDARNGETVLVAGAKAATQTPPIRSGRRVIFTTLDDSTGLVDCAFFDAPPGPGGPGGTPSPLAACAHTVFHSWLLLVRGTVQRRGPRSLSVVGEAAWNLAELAELRREGGLEAVTARLAEGPERTVGRPGEGAGEPDGSGDGSCGADGSGEGSGGLDASGDRSGEAEKAEDAAAGRTIRLETGYEMHPWADLQPPGERAATGRKLWHSSPGSAG